MHVPRRAPAMPRSFNLAAVKAKVVAAMGRTAPRTFKAFFASDADCDHLLEVSAQSR